MLDRRAADARGPAATPFARFLRGALCCIAAGVAIAGCNSSGSGVNVAPLPSPTAPPGCGSPPPSATYPAVVYLTPNDVANPAGPAACNAQFAYEAHSVVVLTGGVESQLDAALGIGPAPAPDGAGETGEIPLPAVTVTPAASPAPDNTQSPPVTVVPTSAPLQIVALYNSPTGQALALHDYTPNSGIDQDDLQAWIADVTSQAATRAPQQAAPPIGSWVPQYIDRLPYTDEVDNASLMTVTYYKLYNFNTSYDWFMVAISTQGKPQYGGCNIPIVGSGAVGWYNTTRRISVSPATIVSPQLQVYDHGPTTSTSTTTQTFTIGGQLGVTASGPTGTATAMYAQTYNQASVTVTDRTTNASANWLINFDGWGVNFLSPYCPAPNTINTYVSPQAVILQVAQGQPVAVRVSANFNYQYDTTSGFFFGINSQPKIKNTQLISSYTIASTILSTSPASLVIPAAGGTASFTINANIPSAQQQTGWQITGVPSWLVVSQLTGSGTTTVTLHSQAGTAPGSIAKLNIDTNPRGGSPTVETAPLVVTVTAQ